jgi:hypothetical protein
MLARCSVRRSDDARQSLPHSKERPCLTIGEQHLRPLNPTRRSLRGRAIAANISIASSVSGNSTARRFMPFLASVLVHLRQGFGIVQRLANADPSNVAWQRDPALTYIRLRDLHKRQGNGPDRAGAR